MNDLTSVSAKKIAELIKDKQVSCVEVMQAYLARIEQVNPSINAVIEYSPEKALKEAKTADAAIASNKALGILHGVPVTIKQSRKVKGFACNYGVDSPMNFTAAEDATVVSRLRSAGAIVIGISNIPDFSMSYETHNTLYGCTHNPYDLKRSPGGSSGGEAAIIAAGGSAFGIGADGGGSIRQPAHNCGIVGLKPTLGLIPTTGKFPEDGPGIFHLVETQGPMARYVEDIIYALPILAGPDRHDPYCFPIAVQEASEVDLKALRVMFYTHNGVVEPSKEIKDIVEQVAKELSKSVASVRENYPNITKETYTDFEELFFYGGDKGQWLHDRMKAMQVTNVAPPFQAILDRAKQCEFSVTELRRRLIALDQFKFMMMNFMQDADVIICPVATDVAGLYDGSIQVSPETNIKPAEKLDLAYDLTYNLPYNITGWPAVSLRCGTSKEGLPIGVQVIAKAWRDDVALAVAKHLENIFGGWKAPLL
jgi:amidase